MANDAKKHSAQAPTFIIQQGVYRLGGFMQENENGEMVRKEAGWEADAKGGCVLFAQVDEEMKEQTGPAELFAIWDTFGLARRIAHMAETAGRRYDNFSMLEKVVRNMCERDGDPCEYCTDISDCTICPITTIRNEIECDAEGGEE